MKRCEALAVLAEAARRVQTIEARLKLARQRPPDEYQRAQVQPVGGKAVAHAR